jgi:hypothetical protein
LGFSAAFATTDDRQPISGEEDPMLRCASRPAARAAPITVSLNSAGAQAATPTA